MKTNDEMKKAIKRLEHALITEAALSENKSAGRLLTEIMVEYIEKRQPHRKIASSSI